MIDHYQLCLGQFFILKSVRKILIDLMNGDVEIFQVEICALLDFFPFEQRLNWNFDASKKNITSKKLKLQKLARTMSIPL